MHFEACFYGENLRKQSLRNLRKSPEGFSQIIFSKTLPKGDAVIVNFRTLTMKLSSSYKYSISCCFFISFSSVFSMDVLSRMKQVYLL